MMVKTERNWAGIDFGAQMSGCTAVCYRQGDSLITDQAERKRSADQFLVTFLERHNPRYVFIDAPLSLPAVFSGKGDDYMYRQCDRDVKAMSPMFIGALTARAIRLRDNYPNIIFKEAYPSFLARQVMGWDAEYTPREKWSPGILDTLASELPLTLNEGIDNWHRFDAVLCWLIGWRFFRNESRVFGHPDEGQIHV